MYVGKPTIENIEKRLDHIEKLALSTKSKTIATNPSYLVPDCQDEMVHLEIVKQSSWILSEVNEIRRILDNIKNSDRP